VPLALLEFVKTPAVAEICAGTASALSCWDSLSCARSNSRKAQKVDLRRMGLNGIMTMASTSTVASFFRAGRKCHRASAWLA
jgi:hypothetical protein